MESVGDAIVQWLAVHRPERVLTLTAMMTGPMGHDARAAWTHALAGQEPDRDDLPPPAPHWLQHLAELARAPQTSRAERIASAVETWRVLNGDVSSITAPALIVHGTADPLRPPPHGEAVAAQIPGARLRTIPAWDTDSSPRNCLAASPS